MDAGQLVTDVPYPLRKRDHMDGSGMATVATYLEPFLAHKASHGFAERLPVNKLRQFVSIGVQHTAVSTTVPYWVPCGHYSRHGSSRGVSIECVPREVMMTLWGQCTVYCTPYVGSAASYAMQRHSWDRGMGRCRGDIACGDVRQA